MSALGQKRAFAVQNGMSALGQKRAFAVQNGMSALPPKADIRESDWCVSRARFNQPMKNVGGGGGC
jgi:hypothetical protein